jgi:hypothetical protein
MDRVDTLSPTSWSTRGGKPHDIVTRRPSDQYWAGYQLEQYGVLAPRRAHWSLTFSHAEEFRDIALAMRPNDAGYHATG